jgi:cell division protein FtsX
MPNKTGLWGALGRPQAVRVISVLMVVYLLILGGLTYGYANVSRCLAAYSDQSARSTALRAAAAAEDRRLNDAEGRIDDSDRARYRADQAAMARLLAKLGDPESRREERAAEFDNLLKVTTKTSSVLDANEAERDRIRLERQRIEQERRNNPVPPPPSQTC